MEYFSEDHSKALLAKEWLIKVDTQHSIPYLIKFYAEPATSSCCALVTDTKNTWAEVLTSNQFARRWRDCRRSDDHSKAGEDESSWRKRNLELLDRAHTLGGVKDLSFTVVQPSYGDFAFELEGEDFKWRWEPVSLGHKLSSEILSKHLIIPLISVTHLAFASADPVSELSETDLEKAVDKMGRAARRIMETHVKHAISKPRLATTVQRMTALINFVPDLPAITSVAEPPKIHPDVPVPRVTSPTQYVQSKPRFTSPVPPPLPASIVLPVTRPVDPDSATEPESEDLPTIINKGKGKTDAPLPDSAGNSKNAAKLTPLPPRPNGPMDGTDSDSSPVHPPKRTKRPVSSSDEDSEAERRRRVALLKGGASTAGRGTKQPIKRGGKRF